MDVNPERFRGFSASELSTLRKRASRVEYRSDLKIATVPRAHTGPLLQRTPVSHGGILDSQGRLVDASRIVRGRPERAIVGHPSQQLATPDVSIDEPAVYGGVIFDHFGHFLLETLTRLWALSVRDTRPVFFHSPQPLPAYAGEMFATIGLRNAQIIDRPTQFRHLEVPEPSFVIRRAFSNAFRRTCLHAAPAVNTVSAVPLYLCRCHYRRHDGILGRELFDEEHLDAALRAAGCRVYHPEQHPLAHQIRVVNEHSTVVGTVGSAMHLLNFSASIQRVVYIAGRVPNVNFLMGDAMNGVESLYFRGLRQPRVTDVEVRNTLNCPWIVDVAGILDLLGEYRIITRRPALPALPSAATLANYRAAWRLRGIPTNDTEIS